MLNHINLYLDNTHSVGLGDNLCFLSALANLPTKVNLYVSNHHNTLNRLSELGNILQIPKSSVQFFENNEQVGDCQNTGWPIKLLTDYYKPQQVQVNNQLLETNSAREKRCVALAGFYELPTDTENQDAYTKNRWPWCKHRPIEYYAKIFTWLKNMHYDVITVDRFWSLEHKVEALVKNCCAIISYEGGMAHLAHMLQIPCFLIDWKHPSPSTKLGTFHCDFVHMTNSVHILRDDNELFAWSFDQFNHRIKELSQGLTNNRFMSKEYSLNFHKNSISEKLEVLDKHGAAMFASVNVVDPHNSIANALNQYFLNLK
jgi:hypothetical protein